MHRLRCMDHRVESLGGMKYAAESCSARTIEHKSFWNHPQYRKSKTFGKGFGEM